MAYGSPRKYTTKILVFVKHKLKNKPTQNIRKLRNIKFQLKKNGNIVYMCHNLDKEGVPDSRTIRLTFIATSRTAFICQYTSKKEQRKKN